MVVLAQTVLFALLAAELLREDTWLTLVTGREVAGAGPPSEDTLAIYTAGERWIDQQWLAQLSFHLADALGGLALVYVLNALLYVGAIGLAMAVARMLGAASLSVATIAVPALLVAPWSWQPRAQSFAYPLFVGVLALLLADRGAGRRRTLLVLPLLAVWANMHGSVLLGVALALKRGLGGLITARRRGQGSGRGVPAGLLLAPLCLLATPYGLAVLDYYAAMVDHATFRPLAPEWQPAGGPEAIPFVVLAATALALGAWRARALTAFELLVAVTTFAGALTAVRHFVWFALAMLVILPRLVPGPPPRPGAASRWLARTSLAAAVGLIVGLLLQPPSWYQQRWPHEAARTLLAASSADPDSTVFVHGRETDWLLWRYPSLAGRVAYDARLELLSPDQVDDLLRFDKQQGTHWHAAADGYTFIWINNRLRPQLARALTSAQALTVLYADPEVTLLRRTKPSGQRDAGYRGRHGAAA